MIAQSYGAADRFFQLLFATGIEGASNKLAPAASHAGCGAFDLIVRCAERNRTNHIKVLNLLRRQFHVESAVTVE